MNNEKKGADTPKTEALDIMMLVLYKDFEPIECGSIDCKTYHSILQQFTETFRKLNGVEGNG